MIKKWPIVKELLLETLVWGALVVLAVFVGLKLIGFFWPFVISWIIAAIVSPLVRKLEEKMGVKRKSASLIIIFLVLAILGLVGFFLVRQIGRELFVLSGEIPRYTKDLQELINRLEGITGHKFGGLGSVSGWEQRLIDLISSYGQGVAGGSSKLSETISHVTNGLVGIVVMFIAAYYFIAEHDKVKEKVRGWLPGDYSHRMSGIRSNLVGAVGGFVVAQLKITLIIAIILTVGFIILHNSFALLLGIGIALFDLIPVLGSGMILVPWAVVELAHGAVGRAVLLLVLYGVCLLTRQLLQPKMIGKGMGMGTLPTLFLIFTGLKLKGVLGMVVALLIGVIVINLYRFGLFDHKIAKIKTLVVELLDEEDSD
ncbi:MAG: sporulation integral membrane protein YtvI [Lachnospiraceae bacterium]|nr:sporulation integral membrane protein YtvI [Lachnospiraceae bacterium]